MKKYDQNLIKIYQFNHELENPSKILENIKQWNFYKYLIEYCNWNKEKLFYYIQNHCFWSDYITTNWFIKIQWFIIDFSRLMKKYLVKFNYDWSYHKYYSFNKTLLRNSFYDKNNISEILDYNWKY
jgi:hypothetical protein